MTTHREIIERWPTLTSLADDLGMPRGRVDKWHKRNSIRPIYWRRIADAARLRGIDGVTFEVLAQASSAPRVPRVDGHKQAA